MIKNRTMSIADNDVKKEEQEPIKPVADTSETSLPETPVDKVSELEEKLAELNDKYLRLHSDFDNYRKRSAKERIEFLRTAGEDIFISMLSVVDDFERAIKSNETINDIAPVKEGFGLIYNKMKSLLTQRGLEPMESVGKVFDADIHEAITNIPAPSDDMKGKVVEEIEKGYSLNGKVIRFAKVIVGN